MGHNGFGWTAAMTAAVVVMLSAVVQVAHAGFLNTFGNVTQGAPLQLRWEAVDATFYPLTLTAKMINRTEGSRANGVVLNLTSQITAGSEWTWESVPWPLPHVHGAMYEVQVRPSVGNLTVLTRSSYFSVKDDNSSQQKPGQLVTDHDDGPHGPDRTLALGVGVSIGIASAIALTILAVVLRRRRKRLTEEKRRRRRLELNIH